MHRIWLDIRHFFRVLGLFTYYGILTILCIAALPYIAFQLVHALIWGEFLI